MMLVGFLLSLGLSLIFTSASPLSQNGRDDTGVSKINWRTELSSKNLTHHNDLADNVRVFPHQYHEYRNKPERKLKKNPKRTIQKIIKKNKQKKKIIYARRETTAAPEEIEFSQEESYETTPPPIKKTKNIHKIPKYPPPIHKLQFKKDHKNHRRTKRNVPERDNTFIMTDFDQVTFLNNESDDNDMIKVYEKKYW